MEGNNLFSESVHIHKKIHRKTEHTKLQKQEYKDLLKKELRIPVNPATHKFDLSKPQNARNFTLAICGKTKLNMFDKGVCEVPSSVPISFS